MDTPDGLLDAVVDSVPMELAVLDASGTIVYTNEGWRTFAVENGLPGDPGSVGENYLHVLADAESVAPADEVYDAITAVLDGDEGVHRFEYPCHSPEEPRWFTMYVTGMDHDGERYVHLGHVDITDRKLAELDVRERNERLQTVARVLSHDLRNPLNVAAAYLDLLDESVDAAEIAQIDAALDRMGAILADSLVLARGSELGEMEAVRLSVVARAAWGAVETPAAELVVADDLGFVADESLLANLFENLFRNSMEHSSTDGRAGDADGQGDETASGVTVTVGPLPGGGGFYVEDDGPGVPADVADVAFEAGVTTGEDNTGFGLAIVETIAAAHGWSVDLTAGTGGGARFEFSGVETLADGSTDDASGFGDAVGDDG